MAGSALIARASVIPSISGICISNNAMSYGFPSAADAQNVQGFPATGALAFLHPQATTWCRNIWRLVALSSTTSTRQARQVPNYLDGRPRRQPAAFPIPR